MEDALHSTIITIDEIQEAPPTSLTSKSSSGKVMLETLALASTISKAAGVLLLELDTHGMGL